MIIRILRILNNVSFKTEMQKLTLLGILCVHIYSSLRVQAWIKHSSKFSPRQKKINTLLVWVLPFIWNTVLNTSFKTNLMKRKKNKSDDLPQ